MRKIIGMCFLCISIFIIFVSTAFKNAEKTLNFTSKENKKQIYDDIEAEDICRVNLRM